MSTIRDEFEALLPRPFDHLYEFASPFGGTTLRESSSEYNGNRPKRSIALYTAEQMRAMFDAATERAAKQERLPIASVDEIKFVEIANRHLPGDMDPHNAWLFFQEAARTFFGKEIV